MKRILGIDPGSRITGYGVIEVNARHFHYVDSGCIRTLSDSFPEKLKEIYQGIEQVIRLTQPDSVAIEQVFVKKNVVSALKLGQARGAAICACVMHSLSIDEYLPNQVKKAVVGRGHASKDQIQHMVVTHLGLSGVPQADAADALAIAICHAQMQATLSRLSQARCADLF